MNTIVIAVKEGIKGSGFGLDVGWYTAGLVRDDARILVHHDPLIRVNSKGEQTTNFDILFTSSGWPTSDNYTIADLVEMIDSESVVDAHYYNKLKQGGVIGRVIDSLKGQYHTESFERKFLDCFLFSGSVYPDDHRSVSYEYERGLYVLKPAAGARSIDQWLIDTTEHSLMLSWKVIENLPENDEACGGDVNTYLKEHHPQIKFGGGSEGYKKKPLSTTGYVLTPYIENIKTELRLVNVGEKLMYIQERKRTTDKPFNQVQMNDEPYSSSSSVDGPSNPFFNCVQALYKERYNEDILISDIKKSSLFQELFSGINPVIGSQDWFFTEDGHWGIFEFSPEIGAVDYSPEQVKEITEEFLLHICRLGGYPVA